MKFQSLGLAEPIVRAVAAQGYTDPTPIQAQAIPLVLSGRDVLGCAQTGTGKTAAFALPILHRLMKAPHPPAAPTGATVATSAGTAPPQARPHQNHTSHHQSHHNQRGPSRQHIRALILAPTRELALQISESFELYGRGSGLRCAVIFGGVGYNPQIAALKSGTPIIVATPGRLMDLMNQGHVDLRTVEVFVLDEADRMLDMGFIQDIRRITAKLPKQPHPQTLLFSATMPGEIRSLASSLLVDPASIQVAPQSTAAERVEQFVCHVRQADKPFLLTHLVSKEHWTRTIVFTRTKHGADKVVKHLVRSGIPAEAIHGNKSQNARQRALNAFKSGEMPVLVATDIAARGIDVDEISHVINYDLPDVLETYVHRIGRTARAGNTGSAVAFCDSGERGLLRGIERLIRQQIPVLDDHPDYSKMHSQRDAALRAQGIDPMQQDRPYRSHSQGRGPSRGGHGGGGGGGGYSRGERRSGPPAHIEAKPQNPRPAPHGGKPKGRANGSGEPLVGNQSGPRPALLNQFRGKNRRPGGGR